MRKALTLTISLVGLVYAVDRLKFKTCEQSGFCKQEIKKDLRERRAAVIDEVAEAGKSICKARRSFANFANLFFAN
ncbi:unnamed protein product [Haemonchus placei]|uniref:Secreted protein n=1 Tax=Haemonchus placei TaxID=6290 RepID=A0A0N4WPS6_HAEPC|nr:unnamed protein product [Haemonchus placei]